MGSITYCVHRMITSQGNIMSRYDNHDSSRCAARISRLRAATGTIAACLIAGLTVSAGAQQPPAQAVPAVQVKPVPKPIAQPARADRPLKASPTITTLHASLANQALTIEDAVAIALSTSRSLATAAETVMQARGTTIATQAGQGLHIGADYTLTRNNKEQSVDLGGQSMVMQKQYVSQLIASVKLPLDVTGALHAATSQAQFEELAAKLDAARVRGEVVLETRRAFYEALRNEALVTVAETSLQNAQTQLADAQVRLDAGTVTRYDVLSAQTVVSNAEQSLRQARVALSTSMASLKSTMGVDIGTPIRLTTKDAVDVPAEAGETHEASTEGAAHTSASAEEASLVPGKPLGDQGAAKAGQVQSFEVGDPEKLGAEYSTLLGEALKKRPEIARADAVIEGAKKGITIARQNNLPSVNIGYYGVYTPDTSGLSSEKLTGYAMLTVSVPIFDSGVTRGQVQQARARVSSAETDRRTQIDAITLEVRQAWLNLKLAREQISTARQELAQADEAYRLAQLRYSAGVTSQAGVSPIIEMSNAQKALTQAQSNYANALFDYNSGRSAVEKAVGRYSADK